MTEIINISEERSVDQSFSLEWLSNMKESDMKRIETLIGKEISEIEYIIDSPTYGKTHCPNCQSDNVDCDIEQYDEERLLQCLCVECEEFWCEEPEEDILELRDRLAWLVRKRKDLDKRLWKLEMPFIVRGDRQEQTHAR